MGRVVWCEGIDLLDSEIVGLNPAQGIDVCPRLSVLYCPVEVEALRRADPLPKSPTKCRTDKKFHKIILNWNRSKVLIRITGLD
jgi:hypothetical protein